MTKILSVAYHEDTHNKPNAYFKFYFQEDHHIELPCVDYKALRVHGRPFHVPRGR